MPGREDEPESWRLFVALDLPEGVRAELGEWGRRALDDPALRRVGEESIHVTLAFLGERRPATAGELGAAMREAAGTAPRMRLLDAVARPGRGAPRFYALPVLSEGVEALQARLAGLLAGAGLWKPDERPFWPHVTIARVRRGSGRRRPPLAVEDPPGKLPEALSRPFFCRRLTLYRSELQPRGAAYTPLAQVELPVGRQ